MAQRTPLHDAHVAAGARLVDFAGWDMPIQYDSQIEEHHAVRRDAGMFDVSHMTVVDVSGEGARDWLRHLLANDVARLQSPGRALYTCMLKPDAGVIDDLIVYWRGDDRYRLVVNAATRDKDLAWLREHAAGRPVTVAERPDLSMVAVQGPNARERAHGVMAPGLAAAAAELRRFAAAEAGDWFVGRTGYTGEDGYEVILPGAEAPALWQGLLEAGVRPCGLGARDTLRLEAGMNLYGSDMDESVSPLESGLAWTVAWEPADRDFMGRGALELQRAAGVAVDLFGLVLEGKGVLRNHMKVYADAGEGEITSGSFSPTLGRAIALARLPAGSAGPVEVEMRGRRAEARLVRPPFVRAGEPAIALD